MDLTARSLILNLLSTVRRGAMPVAALVEAAALFGFAENNVRVSLSKLYAQDRVARDERGRYRLSPETAEVSNQLRRWRRLEEHHGPWRGGWVAIHCPRLGRGAVRRRRERAFGFLGLRPLEPGLQLRPDNLPGGVEGVRARYFALAPDDDGVLVYGVTQLDPVTDLRARSLWDADALTREYRRHLAVLAASRERLPSLPTEEAMVESFLVGAAAVRYLHLDPLLPESILDPAPRRELAVSAREYDERGRRLWASFLARHGVPHFAPHTGWRATLDVPAAASLPANGDPT